jgi:hypothetical protein
MQFVSQVMPYRPEIRADSAHQTKEDLRITALHLAWHNLLPRTFRPLNCPE